MKRCLIVNCFLFSVLIGYSQGIPRLKKGDWTGKLMIQNGVKTLPFKLTITHNSFHIHNGAELVSLDNPIKRSDSLIFKFPTYNSELVMRTMSKTHLKGYWMNKNKNVRIPCEINYGYVHRFAVNESKKTVNLNGKWEVTFDGGTANSFKGQALLNQNLSRITGTIRTETGDFKYLEGNISGDSVFLSRFDGAHVMLMEGRTENNRITGVLYSGNSGKSTFYSQFNETFELTHPDSLTHVVSKTPLQFQFKDTSGNFYDYPNASTTGKVVIIELMGSWCPNCLDEAHYLKEVYNSYSREDVEIISVAYEVGEQFEQYREKVTRMSTKLTIPYTVLIGGKASKQLASEHFPMLNHIMSFPTTLIIDKKGSIRKIHTGFNGPATGKYYTDFKKEMSVFINQLLAE